MGYYFVCVCACVCELLVKSLTYRVLNSADNETTVQL